jgi:hypothetical protein
MYALQGRALDHQDLASRRERTIRDTKDLF